MSKHFYLFSTRSRTALKIAESLIGEFDDLYQKSFELEILDDKKNILLLETDKDLFFLNDVIDGKKLLDTFSADFLQKLKITNSKILISSIGESTFFDKNEMNSLIEILNNMVLMKKIYIL